MLTIYGHPDTELREQARVSRHTTRKGCCVMGRGLAEGDHVELGSMMLLQHTATSIGLASTTDLGVVTAHTPSARLRPNGACVQAHPQAHACGATKVCAGKARAAPCGGGAGARQCSACTFHLP